MLLSDRPHTNFLFTFYTNYVAILCQFWDRVSSLLEQMQETITAVVFALLNKFSTCAFALTHDCQDSFSGMLFLSTIKHEFAGQDAFFMQTDSQWSQIRLNGS